MTVLLEYLDFMLLPFLHDPFKIEGGLDAMDEKYIDEIKRKFFLTNPKRKGARSRHILPCI